MRLVDVKSLYELVISLTRLIFVVFILLHISVNVRRYSPSPLNPANHANLSIHCYITLLSVPFFFSTKKRHLNFKLSYNLE